MSISDRHLLGTLEVEYLGLTTDKKTGKRIEDPFVTDEADRARALYREALQGASVGEKSDFDGLCGLLDDADKQLQIEGVSPQFIALLQRLRSHNRRRLEIQEGWRKAPFVRHNNLTTEGMRAVDSLLTLAGQAPAFQDKDEFTDEEVRAFHAIAATLGPVAVATYWTAMKQEGFRFSDTKVEGLRNALGQFQTDTYGGDPLSDVPQEIFTFKKIASLKRLFFNWMRDDYFRKHYKDSTNGVYPVLDQLADARELARGDTPREQFIDELITYYCAIEDLQRPGTLRECIGEKGTEFPAKHQRIASYEIEKQRQLLLADEVGTGKTGCAIFAFERLRAQKKAKRMVVICSTAGIGEWEKRTTDANGGYFTKGCAPKTVTIRSEEDLAKRTTAWEAAKTADYVFINYEMLCAKTDGRDHTKLLCELGADFLVVDEAHNIRNPEGEWSDRVYQLSQCDSVRNGYLVLQTATPIYNTVEDAAVLIRLLHAGQKRSPDEDGVPTDFDLSDIDKIVAGINRSHSRLIHMLLGLRMLKRDREDCIQFTSALHHEDPSLEDLITTERVVYDSRLEYPLMTPTERIRELRRYCLRSESKYRQVVAGIELEMARQGADPEHFMNQLLLTFPDLAQGATRDSDDRFEPGKSNEDDYLAGKLRKYFFAGRTDTSFSVLDGKRTGSKVLRDAAGNIETDPVDGAPMTRTRKMLQQWRDTPKHVFGTQFMLTQVGREAIDFSRSTNVIKEVAPTSVPSEHTQVVGRVHRPGQRHNVYSGSFVLRGTIEEAMLQFRARKADVNDRATCGKFLTWADEDVLNTDINNVRRGSLLGFETLSEEQQILWILRTIKGMGKDRLRECFAHRDGYFAKKFARWHLNGLSYSGNTRRLVLAIMQQHQSSLHEQFGKQLDLMDVACGCLSLAHGLAHDKNIRVFSSDIEKEMLNAGHASYETAHGKRVSDELVEHCAMDEIPYKNGSKHLGVISLALHDTKHKEFKAAKGGDERIRALRRFVTSLAMNGLGIITLPENAIEDMQQLGELIATLEQHFGCTVVREHTNMARSTDDATGREYLCWVITFRRTGNPAAGMLPPDAWIALNFHHVHPKGNGRKDGPPKEREPNIPAPGSYLDTFQLGDRELVYAAPAAQEAERAGHMANKRKYKKLCERLQQLVDEHGSIKNIPPEKLLSISLVEINASTQEIKDRYFAELLRKYNGRVESIPIEQLSAGSDVILIREYHKRKQEWYLCVANVKEPGKHPTAGYGKKYFIEEEFKKTEDATTTSTSAPHM